MKKIIFVLLVFFLFTIHFPVFAADVVINEFSSSTTDDWIELYNTATVTAQLTNLRIRDSTSSNKKDLTGELASGNFLFVDFSNWLNNDGDVVRLMKSDAGNEVLLEEIAYGSSGGLCTPSTDGSIGRFPDGNSNVIRFTSHTKELSNNAGQQSLCPTATLVPTSVPTSSPTDAPTSTPTPNPQSSPTVRPSATPTKKPGITPRVYDPKNEIITPRQEPTGAVLGETTNSTADNTKDKPTNNRQGISLLLLLLLIGGGVGCIAGAVILSTKQIRRRRIFNG